MIYGPRAKGAPVLGIIPGTEDVGPLGRYDPAPDDLDDGPAERLDSREVDERIREQVAEAEARRERRKRDRQALAERRKAGLRARHRRKLALLDQRDRQPAPPGPPPPAA